MVAKFKVGDKVYSPTTYDHGTVIEVDVLFWGDTHHRVRLDSGYFGLYEPHELELDLTLGERVASLEKRLDNLETPAVEEPVYEHRSSAETFGFGALVLLHAGLRTFYLVKVGPNRWVSQWDTTEYSNATVDESLKEVLHEGIQ